MELNEVFLELLDRYNENKLAHAYLFETNSVEDTLSDAIIFSKNILCNEKYENNCSKCNLCHLIDNNSLPNLIIINNDNKLIKKDDIDKVKKCFIKKPIYAKYNIYIIVYPEGMNTTTYNRLLKFIEEPENDIIGLLITENKDLVASTIVSRCELLKPLYKDYDNHFNISSEKYKEIYNTAMMYKDKISIKDYDLLWYNNNELVNIVTNKNEIITFLNILYTYYNGLIKDKKTIKCLKVISKYLDELNYNVNINLLLDSFSIEMSEANEII